MTVNKKAITVIDVKFPTPDSKDKAEFVQMVNDTVELAGDHRIEIDDITFETDGEHSLLSIDLSSDRSYKQEEQMDIVAHLSNQIMDYPNDAAKFEYRTNVIETEVEEEDGES